MENLKSLIIQAQQGDLEAFSVIVQRSQDMAVGYAYSILGDFHLAEDAAQEAFIKAYQDLRMLNEPEAFPSWFRRLIFKYCDRLTRGKHTTVLPPEEMVGLPSDTRPPLEKMTEQEMKNTVLASVRALPKDLCQVVTLFYMGGYSYTEIADFLSVPETTIDYRLRTARKQLKERMITMVRDTLREQAPSRNDSLVNIVQLFSAIETGNLEQVKQIVQAEPTLVNTRHPNPEDPRRDGHLPIHSVARLGHVELVRVLLEAGADPIAEFHSTRSYQAHPCALTLARSHGHAEVVEAIEQHIQQMLAANPDTIEETDEHGNTLLHRAVYHEHMPLVAELLSHGAKIDCRNHLGMRPIHLALYGASPTKRLIAGILLSHGAERDIWVASAIGDLTTVRRMLKDDSSLANFHNGAKLYPAAASYPLTIAALEGHLEIVRLLLDRGANPDAKCVTDDPNARKGTPTGYEESGAPLISAISNQHFDVAHLLLDRGARVDRSGIFAGPDINGVLYKHGNPELIDRIILQGCLPEWQSYPGEGSYMRLAELLFTSANEPAWENGPPIIWRTLLSAVRGADMRILEMCLQLKPTLAKGGSKFGEGSVGLLYRTMLCEKKELSWQAYAAIFKRLLEYGADPNERDDEGQAPLHLLPVAEIGGRRPSEDALLTFAELLLDHGADVNAKDNKHQMTPLAWAARVGQKKLVELLLAHGAKPNFDDDKPGTTPLFWAEEQGYTEIAEILREHGATV